MSHFAPGHVHSHLFNRGMDGLARHLLAQQIVHALAPQGKCGQNTPTQLFVLVGWDRSDNVINPYGFPRCLRAHIFEPDLAQHRWWLQKDQQAFNKDDQKRIIYHPLGLGSVDAPLQLTGVGKSFSGRVVRGESILQEHVFMVSIDVQGHELNALQGLEGTVATHGIDVLLIEAIGYQQASVRGTLEWLDAHDYVIFDFVPLVDPCHPSRSAKCSEASQRGTVWRVMNEEWFVTDRRPRRNCTLRAWHKWFVGDAAQPSRAQTDLLAMHRSFLMPAHVTALRHLCAGLVAARGWQLHQGCCPCSCPLYALQRNISGCPAMLQEPGRKSGDPPTTHG